MRRWVWITLLAGCVESNAVQCDGFICADDKLCDNANQQCVTQEQLEECGSKQDLDNCLIGGEPIGVCKNAVCIVATCGDGIVSNTEQCDGAALNGVTSCLDRGWYNNAAVACQSNCLFDESLCEDKCGDGEINGVEFCEPTLTDVEMSCLDFGYDRGLITCSHFCQPDFSSCESFGFAPVGTASTAAMQGVGGTGPNDIWYVGLGAIQHYDGNKWSVESFSPPIEHQFSYVWNSSPSDVWVMSGLGTTSHFDGTAWTKTTISAKTLKGVWGTGTGDVFTAEEDGNILRWNGSQWSTSGTFGQGHTFYEVWGSGPSDVYACGTSPGGDGLIHRFNGTMWTTTTFANADIASLHGRSATDVWALLIDGGPVQLLQKTTGAFTSVVTAPWATFGESIRRVSDTRVIAGLSPDVAIYDTGRMWRMPTPERIDRLWSFGPDDVWGVTADGDVRHFEGLAWLEDNVTTEIDRLAAVSDTEIYAVNDNTMRRWDGDSWNSIASAPFNVGGLWAAAPNDLWAVGQSGGVSRFNGVSWGTVTSTGLQLTAIHGVSTTDVWAVGRSGAIVHYNGTWSAPHTTPHPTLLLFDVRAFSATEVYAVGFLPQGNLGRGVLLRYTGGTSWEEVTLPTQSFGLLSVWGTTSNNIYVSGFSYVYHYDGQTWTSQELGSGGALYSVRGTGANDVYVTGNAGFMAYNNGTGWVPMRTKTDEEIDDMIVTPHHVVLAAGDGTHVFLKP